MGCGSRLWSWVGQYRMSLQSEGSVHSLRPSLSHSFTIISTGESYSLNMPCGDGGICPAMMLRDGPHSHLPTPFLEGHVGSTISRGAPEALFRLLSTLLTGVPALFPGIPDYSNHSQLRANRRLASVRGDRGTQAGRMPSYHVSFVLRVCECGVHTSTCAVCAGARAPPAVFLHAPHFTFTFLFFFYFC